MRSGYFILRRLEEAARNFSYRNAFILLLIIVTLHLIVLLFYLNGNRLARRTVTRDSEIQKIVNVVNLIYATPVENREQAISAITDPYLDATITKTPAWGLQFRTISYWQISQALHRQLELFSVSIELEKDQWLNIHATIYTNFLMKQLIFFVFEIVIFGLVLGAVWVVGRYVRALQSFKCLAERLGIDPGGEEVPMDDGPWVVREAAKALNTMQRRIQDLIRDRTQMLAAISHDLRTPITRMKLRAQIMGEAEMGSDFMEDLDEMEAMVNETLSFARDDSAKEMKNKINFTSLIQSICDATVDMGGNVSFEPGKRVSVEGKSLALKRALTNLINNAVRYGEVVHVYTEQVGDTVKVMIEDEGPGIPEQELDRVFDPFYRAEASRSRDTGGVGLGLAVTKDIMKAHRGNVSLRNRPEGGLCATLELPCSNSSY